MNTYLPVHNVVQSLFLPHHVGSSYLVSAPSWAFQNRSFQTPFSVWDCQMHAGEACRPFPTFDIPLDSVISLENDTTAGKRLNNFDVLSLEMKLFFLHSKSTFGNLRIALHTVIIFSLTAEHVNFRCTESEKGINIGDENRYMECSSVSRSPDSSPPPFALHLTDEKAIIFRTFHLSYQLKELEKIIIKAITRYTTHVDDSSCCCFIWEYLNVPCKIFCFPCDPYSTSHFLLHNIWPLDLSHCIFKPISGAQLDDVRMHPVPGKELVKNRNLDQPCHSVAACTNFQVFPVIWSDLFVIHYLPFKFSFISAQKAPCVGNAIIGHNARQMRSEPFRLQVKGFPMKNGNKHVYCGSTWKPT